jgi:hypothetical protein
MSGTGQEAAPPSVLRLLWRKDVLAGLLFIAVAVVGLYASRDYPIGTATRMGTGYVPRLLCWILLGLGLVIFVGGLRSTAEALAPSPPIRRALIFVPASLLVFAFAIGRLGVVVAIVLLVAVGAFAGRDSRPFEAAAVALALIALTLAIFVWGIGLPIPVWPEW